MQNNKFFYVIAAVLIIILLGMGIWFLNNRKIVDEDVSVNVPDMGISKGGAAPCPQDAKLCPDGSSVGRTGTNCEFAPCPGDETNNAELTKTYTNKNLGISFNYPDGYSVTETSNPQIKERSVTITGNSTSWKILVFNNVKHQYLKDWFYATFIKAKNVDCNFTDSEIKVASYYTKHITGSSCQNGGYYANSDDNSKVVRINSNQTPIDEINTILSTFKFGN